MLALAFALAYIEHSLPPLPFMPPNVRLGLSNIVTMFCIFHIGKSGGALICVLKACFVLLTRGPYAGLLSLCGGSVSVLVMILLFTAPAIQIPRIYISAAGGVFHNLGQLAAVCLIMKSAGLFAAYAPLLILSGLFAGIVTGALFNTLTPALEKFTTKQQ